MARDRKEKKPIFIGTFVVRLDSKNRISIPAKWKHFLTNEIVIKGGYDGCLEIRTVKCFEEYSHPIIHSDNATKESRIQKRLALGGATNIDVDSWNRFSMPAHLINSANITKEIYLVGLGNVIELWSAELYESWKDTNNYDSLKANAGNYETN